MIQFEYLNKNEITLYAPLLFDILCGNMSKIAPTGNTPEEDFRLWSGCIDEAIKTEERNIILIKDNQAVVGYFQYSVNADTFFMEEIQLKPDYQGKGVFRALYEFVFNNIKHDLKYVKAFASISNQKSIGVLEHLGLKNASLNKNGRSYEFMGEFADLIKWYEKDNSRRLD